MRSSLLGLVLLSSGGAHATIELSAMLGFAGEGDCDDCLGNDDLERDFGVMVFYEIPLPEVTVGPRAAIQLANGDDTDGNYRELDVGGWLRWVHPAGKVDLFAAGGVGLSHGQWSFDTAGGDADLAGLGYHFVAGGGAIWPTANLELVGGLYYAARRYPELEDTVNGLKVTVDDAETDRFLLTAGVRF